MKESSPEPTCIILAGNTYNPCLVVLRQKGYRLWVEGRKDRNIWCARKAHREFAAYSAPELLGLVAMWEARGDDWQTSQPDIYSELLVQRDGDSTRRGDPPG